VLILYAVVMSTLVSKPHGTTVTPLSKSSEPQQRPATAKSTVSQRARRNGTNELLESLVESISIIAADCKESSNFRHELNGCLTGLKKQSSKIDRLVKKLLDDDTDAMDD
jgi:hypothetical protein